MKNKLLVLCLATLTLVGCNNSKPEPKPDPTEPTSITLSDDEEVLDVNATTPYTLTATVLPETAIDKSVTWTSLDPSVIEVIDGKCYAKSIGATSVVAKTCNGLTATCEFKVAGPGPVIVDIKKGEVTTMYHRDPSTEIIIGSTTMKLDNFKCETSIADDKVHIEFTDITWTCLNTTDTSLTNALRVYHLKKSGEITSTRLAIDDPDTTEIGQTYHDDKTSWNWDLSNAPYTFFFNLD